jgi:hypothetical protein
MPCCYQQDHWCKNSKDNLTPHAGQHLTPDPSISVFCLGFSTVPQDLYSICLFGDHAGFGWELTSVRAHRLEI